MKGRVKFLVVLVLCSLIVSCAKEAVNLAKYRMIDLDSRIAVDELPPYVIEKPKVAVLPAADTTEIARKCKLGQMAQEHLTQTLTEIGGTNLVERGQIESIMQEIKFQVDVTQEIDIKKFMEVAKDVDFAFVGSVLSASVTAEFSESKTGTDKKGKTQHEPPKCTEEAKVMVAYRLVAFPVGIAQKAFQLNGRKAIYRQVRSPNDCMVQDPCSLLSQAIHEAVNDAKESFAETFPRYGYIYKTMTHGSNPKNRIAFITLGKSDGIKAGDKVEIIEFRKEKDPVKGIDFFRPTTIGECTVVEIDLFPDSSICIIPKEIAQQVFVKHVVKTKVTIGVSRRLQKLR